MPLGVLLKSLLTLYYTTSFSQFQGREQKSCIIIHFGRCFLVFLISAKISKLSKGKICITQPILAEWNKKISSRDIRKYLENGEVKTANSLLGNRYFVEGEVVHGRGVGATYGLPTANLNVSDEKVIPLDGVYDTRVKVGGEWYKGVTNVGTCPTFDFHRRTVETHILDFSADIYGEIIRVEFVERIRCVVKFNSLEELKAQIYDDIEKVRESND